jgi:hypothetical protein
MNVTGKEKAVVNFLVTTMGMLTALGLTLPDFLTNLDTTIIGGAVSLVFGLLASFGVWTTPNSPSDEIE